MFLRRMQLYTFCLAIVTTCLMAVSCSKSTEPVEEGFVCIDYELYTHPLSTVDIPGDYAFTLALMDGVAYVPDRDEILIFDMMDPDHPSLIGSVDVGSIDVELSGDGSHLYSIGATGLRILDLTDPRNPVLQGSLQTSGFPNHLAAVGDHVYVCNLPSSPIPMDIVDVSDPENPDLAASADVNARDLVSVGGYLYAVSPGIRVLDISNPTSPVEVGGLSGSVEELCVHGEYAYATMLPIRETQRLTGRIRVISVSSPDAPTEIGTIDIPEPTRSVAVSGSVMAVGIDYGALIFDLTSPTSATLQGVVGLLYPQSMEIRGERLYVGGRKLHTIDISNPHSPPFVSLTPVPGRLLDLVVQDGYAYLADRDNGVRVMQVEPATDPMLLETIPGTATDLALDGSLLCYLDGTTFQVLDASSPGSPVSVGSLSLPAIATSLALNGSKAYVGDLESGFHVVDLGDPTAPQVVGSLDLGLEPLYGMTLMDHFVLVAAAEEGLQIIDVSDPSALVVAGSLAQKNSRSVALSGSYAFVANGPYEMSVVDVSDPTAPQVLGTFEEHEWIADLAVAGSILYAASDLYGMLILDILNPTSPKRVGSVYPMFAGEPNYTGFPDGREVPAVYVSGDHVYLATSEAGLGIVPRHCP